MKNQPLLRTILRIGGIVAFVLALSHTLPAQTKARNTTETIDLRQQYDVFPSDAKLTLGDIFTTAEAKAKYKDLWRGWQDANWKPKLSDADLMRFTLFEAAHWDALLRNADLLVAGSDLPHGVLIASRNWIIWPAGGYLVTRPLEYAFGIIEGSGTGVGNIEYGGRGGATEIEPWHERWVDNPKHIVVMRSAHHGSNNNLAYSEGVAIRNFRVNGKAGKWHDPNRVVSGVIAWDLGEASDVTDLFIHRCDTGLNIVRGTPFTNSGCISLFENNCAGLRLTGGGTVNIATLSGDDNALLVHSTSGYGRPATCRLNIGAVKSEFAITSGRQFKPNTWMLEGWFRVNIGVLSVATGNVYQDAQFVVNPTINTSHIRVGDLTVSAHQNVDLLLRDRVNKEAWDLDDGFDSGVQEFRWTSVGGGNLESWPTQAPRIDYPYGGPQLGYLKGDPDTGSPVGSFDRVNGKPTWSDITGSSTAPVTPTCSWVLGTPGVWSTCANNQQTRTTPYVSSTTGCSPTSPKPADKVETQACGTTPPPSGAVYTWDNPSVTASNWTRTIAPVTVKRIVITGWKPKAGLTPNYHSLIYKDGTPTGHLYALGSGFGFGGVTCPHTLVNGVLTITLPSPVTIVGIGTGTGGGGMQYTGTKLELFAQ